jgi:hypothetical protein
VTHDHGSHQHHPHEHHHNLGDIEVVRNDERFQQLRSQMLTAAPDAGNHWSNVLTPDWDIADASEHEARAHRAFGRGMMCDDPWFVPVMYTGSERFPQFLLDGSQMPIFFDSIMKHELWDIAVVPPFERFCIKVQGTYMTHPRAPHAEAIDGVVVSTHRGVEDYVVVRACQNSTPGDAAGRICSTTILPLREGWLGKDKPTLVGFEQFIAKHSGELERMMHARGGLDEWRNIYTRAMTHILYTLFGFLRIIDHRRVAIVQADDPDKPVNRQQRRAYEQARGHEYEERDTYNRRSPARGRR